MEDDTRRIKNDSSDEEQSKAQDLEENKSSSSSSSASSIKEPIPIHEPEDDTDLHIDSSNSDSSSDPEPPSPDVVLASPTQRKSVLEKISSLSQFGIEISVTNPQIKGTIFKKHIMYTVSGIDSLGGFQVQRRYKEFLALRKVLITEWPGCCILSLPPKAVIVKYMQGNLQPDFVESRRKLLEYFLKSITKNSYLLISEEFQLFLRGPQNFHKANIAQKAANFVQIGQKYSKIFEQYWSFKRDPDIEKEILNTADFFDKGRIAIEKVERCAEENQGIFISFEKKSDEIVHYIQELTKNYAKVELYLNPTEPVNDPYLELKTWCRNNILEVKGISECIHRRAEIEKYKNSLMNKVQDEKKSIANRQAGKKKLIQYLNKKSNEYYISQSEAVLQQLDEILAGIDIILNISAAIILKEEVPGFKQEKVNALRIIVEVFEEMSEKGISAFIGRFEEIKQKI